MARSVKTPADNVGVVEISSDDKGATVTTAASDMSNSEKTPATGAHETFGEAPPSGEIEYVKGHPVIRSGEFLTVDELPLCVLARADHSN